MIHLYDVFINFLLLTSLIIGEKNSELIIEVENMEIREIIVYIVFKLNFYISNF